MWETREAVTSLVCMGRKQVKPKNDRFHIILMHNAQTRSRSVKNYLISLEETVKHKPGISFWACCEIFISCINLGAYCEISATNSGVLKKPSKPTAGLLWSLSKCLRLNLICSDPRQSPCFKANLKAEDLDYIGSSADVFKSFCLSQMKLAARFS